MAADATSTCKSDISIVASNQWISRTVLFFKLWTTMDGKMDLSNRRTAPMSSLTLEDSPVKRLN